MVKRHLKRLACPKTWNISKKSMKFVARPNPGAHPKKLGIPLSVILKDLLKFVKTLREVKIVLNDGLVFVDGKIRKDPKFMAGFLDGIWLAKNKEAYRILLNNQGKLFLRKSQEGEIKKKVSGVIRKKKIGKDRYQINTMDSRTFITEKPDYKAGDSLVFSVPEQKLIELLKLEKMAIVFLTGGSHVGEIGTVQEIGREMVIIKSVDDSIFETKKKYLLVIGRDRPILSCFNTPDKK